MDGEGIRVGSVLGAPVLLRPSWFVVVGVVTLAFAPHVMQRLPDTARGMAYLVAMAFALVLFASVFLHELAHALTARAVGSPPAFIVLDLWGGHTAFSAELITPARSMLVAAAGPLTNAALGLAGLAASPRVAAGGVADLLLSALIWSNGFVAAFNALPGLPLDGGRILEGVVWAVRGDRTSGTLAAGWGGRVVAAAVAGFAVAPSLASGARLDLFFTVSMLAIAVLLWRGAEQTIRLARWRRRAPAVTVRALLRPATAVSASATVAEATTLVRERGVDDLVILDGAGRPAAVLDHPALANVPGDRTGAVDVGAVARALPATAVLGADLAGEPLVERMQSSPSAEYAVLDEAGTVIGVLRWRDVATRIAGR